MKTALLIVVIAASSCSADRGASDAGDTRADADDRRDASAGDATIGSADARDPRDASGPTDVTGHEDVAGDAEVDRDAGGPVDAVLEVDAAIDVDATIDVDAAGADAADAGPAPLTPLGGPCTRDDECAPGLCFSQALAELAVPQGYCTNFCRTDDDCGSNGSCIALDGANPNAFRLCFSTCTSTGGCAYPYQACWKSRLQGIVLQKPVCLTASPVDVNGQSCFAPYECGANSFCVNNTFTFPGGSCLTEDCGPAGATTCGPNSACVNIQGEMACQPTCTSTAPCRPGYTCAGGLCAPLPSATVGNACQRDDDCGPVDSRLRCLRTSTTSSDGFCSFWPCSPLVENCGLFTCPSRASCPQYSRCVVPSATVTPQLDPYCVLK